MELRIRLVLGPFARVAALLLKKAKASALAVASVSIFISLLAALSFYLTARDPYNEGLLTLPIAFVLLSAFFDEAAREFAKLKKPTELERVGFELAGYADVFIVLAAVQFLRGIGYDFDAGYLRGWADLTISGVFIFGLYLLNRAEKWGSDNPGLSARSERMLILTIFLMAGLASEGFPSFLLMGLATLGVLVYAAAFWKYSKGLQEKHPLGYNLWLATRPIKNLLLFFFEGLATLVRAIPRAAKGLSKFREAKPQAEEAEVSRYARVSGHSFTAVVTDGKSSKPIADSKVTFEDKETGKKTVRYTDSAGRSEFDGIGEGHYAISIQAEGFKAEEYERYISMDSGEVFALSKHSSDLSIVVTDGDRGKPVGDAKVKLKNGGQEFEATSDNLGVAYFGGLEVVAYDLSVEAEGYSPFDGKVDLAVENLKSVELKKAAARPESRQFAEPEEEPVESTETEDEGEIESASEGKVELASEEEEEEVEPEGRITQVMGESALVECTPASKIEKAAIKLAKECLAHDREVCIVASQRRAATFRGKLAKEADKGKVRIIELVQPGKDDGGEGVIPMDDLKRLRSIFEELSAGGVMIFEALSSLILIAGGVAAYKFISDALRYFSAEGLCLVCFIEKDAHDESEIASFEKLFVNIVDLQKDEFVLRA